MEKGTALHEIFNLPIFWHKVLQVPKSQFEEEKIRFGKHQNQYLLLLKKNPEKTPKGLVVYFHGGGWRFGHPEMFKINAQFFLDEGFWVALPTYRRIPYFNFLHMREDVSLAYRALLHHLESARFQNLPVILGGTSAGGNLAAHLFYNEAELNVLGASQTDIAGLFFCGAPLDLEKMWHSPVLQSFAGSRKGKLFQLANPMNYLPPKHFPETLIFHGTKDGLVEVESTISFVENLQTYQKSGLRFHLLEGATHLDSIKWVYQDGEERSLIKNWLKNLKS